MFKAKLIQDQKYYPLRRNQLLLHLLPAFLIGILVNILKIPLWVAVLVIVLYGLAVWLIVRNKKAIDTSVGNQFIQMNEDRILLTADAKLNTVNATIELREVDKIIAPQDYQLPDEKIGDLVKEIQGEHQQNFIILQLDDEEKRFDFIIDSYYMINQLQKLLQSWEAKGYPVDRRSKLL